MKRPAKLLSAACLATFVAGTGFECATAADVEAAAQDLVQVSATNLVISASWTKRPDAYVLQLVLDPSVPVPRRESALPRPVATANPTASTKPITTISREEMERLGIINMADALTQLVPRGPGLYIPQITSADGATMTREDRAQFFIAEMIANLRGMDPSPRCGRTLTLVDRRSALQDGQQPAPATTISYLNQPYPPEHKDPRVDVWLLKADGTQILPATYSCAAGPTSRARTDPPQPIEISYEFPIADSAQAVAATIRIDDNFYIEKLQPAPQPAAR